MCELQQGATLAFSVSGTLFQIISIGRLAAPIPTIDDVDLADTGGRKKCPGKLRDPQPLTIVARNIGTQARPAVGVIQDLTITHPLVAGGTTPEILDGSGFITDVRTPEFNSDSEARQTIEIDWQFDGNPMPTRTLAA